MIVDAHVHVASPDTERFPRRPTGLGSDWWQRGGSSDELVATLDAHEVGGAVVVQAIGVYGYDCNCAVAAVADHPDRLMLVGAVDMSTTDPVADLQQLAASAPLRGLRLFGVGGDEPRWLTDGRGSAVLESCSDLGIPIVPTLFPDHLGNLADLLDAHDGVHVALDHCGFVDPAEPDANSRLAPLAERPTVTLKVTSHTLHAAADGDGDPARFVDTLVASLGADRLCWGSDFPQHQDLGYRQMLELARRSTRNLSSAEQEQFFAATSRRLFWRSQDVRDR